MGREAGAFRKLLVAQGVERLGFYIVLDLIGLYANEKLGWSESSAALLGGLLGGAAYAGPICGGSVSDRVGRHVALAAGAVALCVSYFSLAFGLPMLLVCAALAVGNGLYKPAATATAGSAAMSDDARRAIYKFYAAINVGALTAAPLGELIKRHFGWTVTFAAAAAMLAVTLVLVAQRDVREAAASTSTTLANTKTRVQRFTAPERALYGLYAAAALFWCAFNQFNGSLTFFAKNAVDRTLMWFVVPPVLFASLNSVFVIALGERVPLFFKRCGLGFKHQLVAGMLIVAAGFGAVAAVASGAAPHSLSMLWLLGIYFALTVAELAISPAIIAMLSDAAPAKRIGAHMGFWFGSNAAGYALSGGIGWIRGLTSDSVAFALTAAVAVVGACMMWLSAKSIVERDDEVKLAVA